MGRGIKSTVGVTSLGVPSGELHEDSLTKREAFDTGQKRLI